MERKPVKGKRQSQASAKSGNVGPDLIQPLLTRVEYLRSILERRIQNLSPRERDAAEWSTKTAAKVSGKDSNTIRNWISVGKVIAAPMGSTFLVDRQYFIDYLIRQAAKSDEPAPVFNGE